MFVHERFVLDNSIVDEIEAMTPKFGYNGFGEFVFYRTYSRVKSNGQMETWNDVVKRVVQGTFSIRKDHYIKNHILWNEDFWQHYARQFALSLFHMKWLPPGRGLWAMGTEFIYERGSMALQNCAFTNISHEIGNDIHWMMDCLMCGVGVGFYPTPNEIKIYQPSLQETEIFRIPDSREGWCDSVKVLINSYCLPFSPTIKFDYNSIRPLGAPIRGFGGTCSGPGPLATFHEQIRDFFKMYLNYEWYNIINLKTDIANACGCCVVAGNVRRSAELALGSINDPTFVDLKNYDIYPYRAHIGWMSNNSVMLEEDEDFEKLDIIAQRVIDNGEPGLINLRNFPKGRIGKNDLVKSDPARGINPCSVGATKVLTADGRGYVAIQELAEIGDDLPIFCLNDFDEICIRTMRNPRITGINETIYRVVFDNGDYIRVTKNHKFMLRDRSFKTVMELKPGDQLATVNRYHYTPQRDSYWSHYIQLGYSGLIEAEHRLIGFNKFGDVPGYHIHHIDGNKRNNDPNNLELVAKNAHLIDHSKGSSNPNFSGISNKKLLELGVQLCKKLGRRFSTVEYKEHINIQLTSKYRTDRFCSCRAFSELCAELAEVLNEDLDTRILRFYQKMLKQGYETKIENGKVLIKRFCEICKAPFWIIAQQREQACCSTICKQIKRGYIKKVIASRQIQAKKKETLREKQLDIFTKLQYELKRTPTKIEWQEACSNQKINFENENWDNLVCAAKGHNHRVLVVIEDGIENVYNGTVDEFNNFIVGGWLHISKTDTKVERGIVNAQCGEQVLEGAIGKEACTLAETLPTRCNDHNDWLKACEYATCYASTVTLLPTHRPETNEVMCRNRRIGVGIVDVSGWKFAVGANKLIKYLRQGYAKVTQTNIWLNGEAGVPEAIRKTTIKPGGTVPKLAGRTAGIGNPTFHYTLRRVRVALNSPIVDILQGANIPFEPDVNDPDGTLVFEWPIEQGPAKPAEYVTLWEQALNIVMMQREWSDNAVSNTLTFKPDEIDDIESVLSAIVPQIKSLSLLPQTPEGIYPQMPESRITREEYDQRLREMSPINWSVLTNVESTPELYCTKESCQ